MERNSKLVFNGNYITLLMLALVSIGVTVVAGQNQNNRSKSTNAWPRRSQLVPGHACLKSNSTAWRTDATELTCTVLVTS